MSAQLEQDFQNALVLAIYKQLGIKMWRNASGKIRTDKRTWVQCGPVGSSDLIGIVPKHGVMLCIECKGPRTRETPEQVRWRDYINAQGGIALTCRWTKDEDLDTAVDEAVRIVRHAIVTRFARAA